MAMTRPRTGKPRPPLDAQRLQDLALTYVGRFATSRSKLAAYLARKVKERGWDGERPADIEALVERIADLGYVDDAAYALSKARSLTARGYGERRVRQALSIAGIDEGDRQEANDLASDEAAAAALRYARRKRIGPYGTGPGDARDRERQLAAMIRAGHGFALARAIVESPPGSEPDPEVIGALK